MSLLANTRRLWRGHRARDRLLLYLGVTLLLGRFWLLWWSEGTNDIRTWQRFGTLVQAFGLGQAYVRDPLLNHPPLATLWAALVAGWAEGDIMIFARAFKLPAVLAECAIAAMLLHILRLRGSTQRGCEAFAAYGLTLASALICAFHGNTDTIYSALVLAAIYLLHERGRALAAGLLLALALNIKLIPILVVIPLAACCRDGRALLRFGVGLAAAVVPYALALGVFSADERVHFVKNVFGYKSYPEWWGVEQIVRTVQYATIGSLPSVHLAVRELQNAYAEIAGKLLVLMSAVLALWARRASRGAPNAYALCGVASALLLVLGPGFGVQYFACLIPLFLVARLRSGIALGIASSLLNALIYLHFVNRWDPLSTEHRPFGAELSGITAVTWFVLTTQTLALCRLLGTRDDRQAGMPAHVAGDARAR